MTVVITYTMRDDPQIRDTFLDFSPTSGNAHGTPAPVEQSQDTYPRAIRHSERLEAVQSARSEERAAKCRSVRLGEVGDIAQTR